MTPMHIRKLTAADNLCYFRWFEHWNKEELCEGLRCEEVAVVEKDGEYGAGIMVQRVPGAAYCMFSHITRNPFCNRDFSSEAVDFLIKNLSGLSKKLGYNYFVAIVGSETAKARFRKNGIVEVPENLTMFWGANK